MYIVGVYIMWGGGSRGGGGGGDAMQFMRWSETLRISSLVRPRGHTTTSAIAKSDFSLPLYPALTNSDTSPWPRVAPLPTETPVDQQLRARIGSAHDHPVRVRADVALGP